MQLALDLGLIAVGLALAIGGSRFAVERASSLAAGSRIPPFVIGITLLALGTDLPEIANSIVASVAGHGDLNVGDSVGSTVTQVTLVLGLLPFLVGPFMIRRETVSSIATAIVVALTAGTVLLADGHLSRLDGLALVVGWIVASFLVWRHLPTSGEPELPLGGGVVRRIGGVFVGLIVVAAGASAAVLGLIGISATLGVPEYIISFFGASIGTSLPELVVNITALRRGELELAVGDVLGSSLADATLSIGAGPLVAPVAVTASLAIRGSLAAAAVIGVSALLLARRERHDRRSGLILLLLYSLFYPLMLSG